MKPKCQKLASLAQEICTLWFQFFGAVFASKGYLLKNIIGYNLDIMRQSACLVLNPITVYSYGFLFNCTTVGQTSDSKTALT